MIQGLIHLNRSKDRVEKFNILGLFKSVKEKDSDIHMVYKSLKRKYQEIGHNQESITGMLNSQAQKTLISKLLEKSEGSSFDHLLQLAIKVMPNDL